MTTLALHIRPLPESRTVAKPEQECFDVVRVPGLMTHVRSKVQRISGTQIIAFAVDVKDYSTGADLNEFFADMAIDFSNETNWQGD